MNYLAILFPAIALVLYKANAWNANPALFAAQRRERADASKHADILIRFFDALDTAGTGLLTNRHWRAVDNLPCSDSEKDQIRAALCLARPTVFEAKNPWYLASPAVYQLTAIGHVIGQHKETRVAVTGGMYGGYAAPYDVIVNDYAISKADLESYVTRVNARGTLAAK
jgi:hypothetical protein